MRTRERYGPGQLSDRRRVRRRRRSDAHQDRGDRRREDLAGGPPELSVADEGTHAVDGADGCHQKQAARRQDADVGDGLAFESDGRIGWRDDRTALRRKR